MIFIPPWWDQSFDLGRGQVERKVSKQPAGPSPSKQVGVLVDSGEFLRQGFLGMFLVGFFWGRPFEAEFLVGGTCCNPSRQLKHDWYRIELDRGIKSWKRPMKPCMNSTCNWNVGGGIYLAQIP